MIWMDLVGVLVGFVAGWCGAMVYYRRLCSLGATVKAAAGIRRRG